MPAYAQYALDDYGVIKCINFIRRAVADGADPLPQLQQGPAVFEADEYLRPVKQDDALLFHDFTQEHAAQRTALAGVSDEHTVEQLRAENDMLRQALQQLRVNVRSALSKQDALFQHIDHRHRYMRSACLRAAGRGLSIGHAPSLQCVAGVA